MSANKIPEIERKRSRPVEKRSIFKRYPILIPLLSLIIVIVFVASIIFVFGIYDPGEENDDNGGGTTTGNPIAIINTSMGTIKVELFEEKVPNTVDNFVKLANSGFYDGLVFHRVIDDFMIQGGGFNSDGTQKQSPYGSIDLEINPEVRHVDGAIGMARTKDPNSATSQFYICDGEQSNLDDQYAAFGITIEGINVVRDIALVDTTTKNTMSDWPKNDVTINSITIE